MSGNGNCYNNPAFCNQFDSSLYDYEYVPEIDPDSPDVEHRQLPKTRLVFNSQVSHYNKEEYNSSDEFEDSSDNSNHSIVVEERNNRRITMICEKRNKDENDLICSQSNGAYYQQISLESENQYPTNVDSIRGHEDENVHDNLESNHDFYQQRCRPVHRYEDIQIDDCSADETPHAFQRVHRYAEISIDQNGYPKLENEVHIMPEVPSQNFYRNKKKQSNNIPKTNESTYIRTVSPSPPPRPPRSRPTSPVVIEMSDFSPPRRDPLDPFRATYSSKKQNKRHPPIGASSPVIASENTGKNKNSISKNLSKITSKISGHVKPTHSGSLNKKIYPREVHTEKSIKSLPKMKFVSSHEGADGLTIKHPTRRKIFLDIDDMSPRKTHFISSRSPHPYQTTTKEIKKNTAVITPILPRKPTKEPDMEPNGYQVQTPKKNKYDQSNIAKMSARFQSTGRIFENPRNKDRLVDDNEIWKNRNGTPPKMTRNQSVPNFRQLSSSRNFGKSTVDLQNVNYQSTPKKTVSPMKQNYHGSPQHSYYQTSPINRSRLSLIEQVKHSWSSLGPEFSAPPVGCISVMAFILLFTGLVSCVIGFYLSSKLGRRYYLDFGLLASFINMSLGILGFRAHCWKWLPNRNYVSGYIFLAIFSALTCSALATIIIIRPMAGDPLLDIASGAIGGVSVLTVILSVTGLTMSRCCKTPPPDNRVANV